MLKDLKIVEFATMIAAPAATCLLADWGAQVIKIEPHRGDPMRGGPGSVLGSTNFDLHNRGKRSIALDTGAPDTREIILKLLGWADVLVTNMLPGQLAKLKLDWESLHPLYPRLVYASVSSFGLAGPDRDRGATDNLGFWARGGGTGLLTVEGNDPVPIRQSVGDRITGLAACVGLLAALTDARATGRGRFVDTALMATGMWAFSTDLANYMNRGRIAVSKGRKGAALPLSNYFKTRDGQWLQLHTDVATLAKAVDRPDLAADPRFQGRVPPREHHAALVELVDEIFAQFDDADIRRRLNAAGARFEPVQTPAEIAADPQTAATGRFVQVNTEDGPQWGVAAPSVMMGEDGPDVLALGAVPALGQHTVEVLREFGYSDADVRRMADNGTIPRGVVA